MSTPCTVPLEDALSSFSRCQLYYDFSRGSDQRINDSMFEENTFLGNIVDNEYLNISIPSQHIASNSESSISDYSVLFDIEFIESRQQNGKMGHFWSADSISSINGTEKYGSEPSEETKYQFIFENNKLGIKNSEKRSILFSGSKTLNLNQRYLILYKTSLQTAELYIDGKFEGIETISNYGIYSPFDIKIGGEVRNFEAMKVYRYAFYESGLTPIAIKEFCDNNNDITSSDESIGHLTEWHYFAMFVLVPITVIMIMILFCCIFNHKKYKRMSMESRERDTFKNNKEKKLSIIINEELQIIETDEINPTNDQCVVCMDNKREYICTPCGHYCLCIECKDKVNKCPLCQSEYDSIIKVFRP